MVTKYKKNTLGVTLLHRTEGLRHPAVDRYLRQSLPRYLAAIGARPPVRRRAADEILQLALNIEADAPYLRAVREYIAPHIVSESITRSRDARARRIAQQVADRLGTGTVLDLGCGDGAVATLLAAARPGLVLAGDVFRSPEFDHVRAPPFVWVSDADETPLPAESVDCVLLANVLHHAADPPRVLREAGRVLRPAGRLVIVDAQLDPKGEPTERGRDAVLSREYMQLTEEDRVVVTGFIDQLANTAGWSPGIAQPIPCPLNFNTTTGWSRALKLAGFRLDMAVPLGVDQPLGAGMFHGVFIARRRGPS